MVQVKGEALNRNQHIGLVGGNVQNNKMARPAGLEPATYCLEGSCSIQLS